MRYRDVLWTLANCRDTDVTSWYPETGRVTSEHLGILKRICGACEIKTDCLAWALERKERGFWGGQYFPERLERDEEPEGLHTPGDDAYLPDVWEGSETEMCAEDW